MRRRTNLSMFPCRVPGNDQRMLATALVSLFIGTFLWASQPRVAGILAAHLPDRESKLLNGGDLLDGVIAGRGLKSPDFQSEVRLLAVKVWDYLYRRRIFVSATDRSIVHDDAATAGSSLIRSPPSVTVEME